MQTRTMATTTTSMIKSLLKQFCDVCCIALLRCVYLGRSTSGSMRCSKMMNGFCWTFVQRRKCLDFGGDRMYVCGFSATAQDSRLQLYEVIRIRQEAAPLSAKVW